ncbi:MAG: hypothetical protein N2Z21_04175 [Candidatus Sumerlaeaceae bacterium]|nr:hypothetical protein [Candidatus Sumerlaeaceae bacterium]
MSKEQIALECEEFNKKKEAVAQAVLTYSSESVKKSLKEWETIAEHYNVETTEQLVAQLDALVNDAQKELEALRSGKAVQKRWDDYLFDALPQVLGVNATDKRAMLAVVRDNQVTCYLISQQKTQKFQDGFGYFNLIDQIKKVVTQQELFVLVLADGGQMGAAWKFIKDLRKAKIDCCLDVITPEWEPILEKLKQP